MLYGTLQVTALDKDAGTFGEVSYDIDQTRSDPQNPPFAIGSKSGELTVSGDIQR